ncbi:hypothetical protein DICPUDRAFT_159140 [Dictyostelium purpureum]|uniref:RING-type domain-containing protein n=1 Tax=Dictyostelium purpureum TaxID=5786 RepID=F1A3D6_DICPU|nr:uncharacterized protein DICPUDRAFT_159140 [Dictyostelium purpureum]EGC29294.1 hypothetical protein DICPUDRAFT_159140 [Dictyostelium purpureum]|eukprot:XP_003294177.1 hypothetical protein DICPUDRAFT_159140 [Dictyostelium purpureum]
MEALVCKGCNKIFEEPLSLSCGDLLCKRCVESSKDNKCKICKQEVTSSILNQTVKSFVQSVTVESCCNHKKSTPCYCLQCNSFSAIDQIQITYH